MNNVGSYYIFNEANKPLIKAKSIIPDLQSGEILVKIKYASLCGSDLHTYCGLRQEPTPTILGHEIVGTIEHIAEGHPKLDDSGKVLQVNDLITWTVFASDPSTADYHPQTPQKNIDLYKYGHRQLTETDGFHGGLATHIILRRHTCIRILPKEISLSVAATINCAIATAAGSIRLSGLIKDKNILVSGMGLLGLTTVAMCKELGAKHIVVTDMNEKRLFLARRFGANQTIHIKKQDINERLNQGGIDRFIDMSGSPEAMEAGIDTLQVNGRAILIGAVFKQRRTQIDAEQIIRKLISIKGLHNYNYNDFSAAVDFMINNWKKYPFTEVIEKEFPVEAINDAFQYAIDEKPIRVGLSIK